MSKLFQLNLTNGVSYATRAKDEGEFLSSSRIFYELKSGCVINYSQGPRGPNIQLLDLSKNKFYGLPIFINPTHIVAIIPIKKDSDLYKQYLGVTSSIVIPRSN